MSSALEDVKSLNKDRLPRHIAIIMDGNRRWAKANKLSRKAGHQEGAKTLSRISQLSRDIGVDYLTVYAFSSENWKRSDLEVEELKFLLKKFLKENLRKIQKENIKVRIIGSYEKFGSEIVGLIHELESVSHDHDAMQLNIALSYGAREEIITAIKNLKSEEIESLTEESFENKLYTANIVNPDLLIRTGGDMRISNFLLWQIAYSELYFTKTLWPSFSNEEFCKIIMDFAVRDRRFGL